MARTSRQAVRVVVCDDNESVLVTLTRALEYREGLEIAAQAESVEELLELVDDARPDVIVLDVNLPGLNGIEGLGELRGRDVRTPVILMSADKRNAEPAEAAGARFFYKGTTDLEDLVAEIFAAAE